MEDVVRVVDLGAVDVDEHGDLAPVGPLQLRLEGGVHLDLGVLYPPRAEERLDLEAEGAGLEAVHGREAVDHPLGDEGPLHSRRRFLHRGLFHVDAPELALVNPSKRHCLYIMPARLNSISTMTMQIMLIRIPMGPLLIFEDGLNPRIGSALLASFSSISPMGFMAMAPIPRLMMVFEGDQVGLFSALNAVLT